MPPRCAVPGKIILARVKRWAPNQKQAAAEGFVGTDAIWDSRPVVTHARGQARKWKGQLMIADRLMLARRQAGYSLRELSAAIDHVVAAQAIGKYERGESIPRSGVLIALSKALGVSIGYLMDTQGIELSGVEFRMKTGTSARERAKVETEVLEWVERYLLIDACAIARWPKG